MKRWLRYFRACIWPTLGARQYMPKALSPSLEALESRRLLAVITVDTLTDAALASSAGDGHISLREAISAANTNASVDGSPAGSSGTTDIIQFAAALAGNINLTAGSLTISDSLNIQGPSATTITINAQQLSRIFDLTGAAGAVTIDSLTLSGGKTTGAADAGGAIRSFAHAPLTIANSTISGNSTTGSDSPGGAIAAYSSDIMLQNSTVSGNSTIGQFAYGGGVYADAGNIKLQNTTISGNSTTGLHAVGGGVSSLSGSVVLQNSTVSGNTTAGSQANGGGIYSFAAATLHNSIVAGNAAPQATAPDVRQGSSSDVQFSLVGDNRGTTGLGEAPVGSPDAKGNLVGGANNGVINPQLAALGNYGGATRTHALLPGSPAINAGGNTLADADGITTDQRGIARPRAATVDMGAFESRGFTLTKLSGDSQATLAGTAFASPLVVQVASPSGEPIVGGTSSVSATVAGNGASATFANSGNATIAANGQASFTATANANGGAYTVNVNVRGAAAAVSFNLTNQLQPVFAGLSGPYIAPGTASVALSGKLAAGSSIPSGNVSITLNGVTQQAAIDGQTGNFSSNFNTSALTTGGSPYTITYSYVASGLFRAASDATRKVTLVTAPTLVGRSIFYNNSAFDGNSAAAGVSDDGAIATDKTALLPGGTATLANYTSYSRGINGIMIDIAARPAGALSASDFQFRVGNNNTPGTWATGPDPSSISVRTPAGSGLVDRITLVWPDGAIQKQWLQVTVKATAATGLAAPAVFYFGNAVGESGNAAGNALVNSTDEISARSNPRTFSNPAPITNLQDYNRDMFVNATDQIIARSNVTNLTNSLKLIVVPAGLDEPLAPLDKQAVAAALASPQVESATAEPPAPPQSNLDEINVCVVPTSRAIAGLDDSLLSGEATPVIYDHLKINDVFASMPDESLLELISGDSRLSKL